MTTSLLGSVTLTYELIWDQRRRRSGVRLSVDSLNPSGVDARHLHEAIAEIYAPTGAPLLLCVNDPDLLQSMLEHAPANGVWLEIPAWLLENTSAVSYVRQAKAHGAHLVWRGEPGQAPDAATLPWFHNTLRSLTPHQALDALRASLRRPADGSTRPMPSGLSPVVTGAFYEGLASQALVDHALDHQRVHGVVGWPAEEILYSYRTRQIQPARAVIESLLDAIGADASLDTLEQRMAHEPVLYYRFLRYMHSPSLGLRGEGGNLRQGLMALGYSHVRDWLAEQLPRASSDANLEPIRSAMVLRARTMEQLAQAGAEDALRREVFLCGLFSQVDVLLGEPLDATLGRIPLPERVGSALLNRTGPYAPWLDVASALESGSSHRVREVCTAHELSLADVNRALLRALAAQAG